MYSFLAMKRIEHPSSLSWPIDRSNPEARWGKRCVVVDSGGSVGVSMLHIWVDCIVALLGKNIEIGWHASVTSMTSMLVWGYWSADLCWKKLHVNAVSATTCCYCCCCCCILGCWLVLQADTLFNKKVFSLFLNIIFPRSQCFFVVATSFLPPNFLFNVCRISLVVNIID